MGTKSFYCILKITFSNARDNCYAVDIVSVEAFCTTVKLLFLFSLVWITETALNIKKSKCTESKHRIISVIGQLTNTH